MFSALAPVLTLVQSVTWFRQPRAVIQRPMMFSDELISRVTSRLSWTPYSFSRYTWELPPP